MQPRLIRFLMLSAVLGVTAEPPRPPFVWWTADPLEKVRPLDPIPRAPLKSVELYAGRNEFEPFQIVLRATDKDLGGVDISFSDFRSAEGAEISRKNVTVYLEAFVNLPRASSSEGGDGLWPDPLIPRVDRYENETRNAFPFAVHAGRSQPVWVEIFVPPTARPGEYTGSAGISFGKAPAFSVPIHLTVWRFTLPSTSSLKSSFGFNGIKALKQHRGRYTDDDELHAITALYTKAALLHRITTYGGTMRTPKYLYAPGSLQIDWHDYDSEVAPYLNGTVIPEGGPLHGARATSVELRTPSEFESEDAERLYWVEWSKHFRKKGWNDRLFLYLWDEPKSRDFAKVLERGKVAMQVRPGIRDLVTTTFSEKLQDIVQIWVPLVNCLELKPGYKDFCEATAPLDSYRREAQQGKSFWFYQSCASHGCNITGGDYFSGWPSYMIDIPGPANRVMQWLAWKNRIEGELYYSMDEAFGENKNPWNDIRLFGGNGDGTLFYPGLVDRIGGRTDIPIESIRLKLIREGMEDYEYLALLAKLAGRQSADQYAERIVKKTYSWESRPEVFLKVRRDLGEALDQAAARSGEAM